MKRKGQAWESSEWWVRVCLHTSVGWGLRACSGRIRAGFGVREAPFSEVSSKRGAQERRKGKRKISLKDWL